MVSALDNMLERAGLLCLGVALGIPRSDTHWRVYAAVAIGAGLTRMAIAFMALRRASR